MSGVRPADYPPPFASAEVLAPPTDAPDERIDVGILIVGAGPGGLACAVRLGQLLEEHPDVRERLGEVPVAVLEKGKQPGSHLLSGAVMNPRAIRKLFAGRIPIEQMPTYGPVHGEAVYLLTKGAALRIPPPPTMMNHGNWIVSISELGRFLAEQAEAGGAMILPETTGQKLLVDHGRVVGVRTGDKGRGKDGEPLSNFEPGVDVTAKVTVLAEGTAGHLTTAAIEQRLLDRPRLLLGMMAAAALLGAALVVLRGRFLEDAPGLRFEEEDPQAIFEGFGLSEGTAEKLTRGMVNGKW